MKIVKLATCLITYILLFQNVNAQMEKSPSLNHIALYVHDLEKSVNFYKDIIGLPTIPEPFNDGRHVWFKIGDHSQLHIILGASAVNVHDKNSHMCFSLPSVDTFILRLNKNKILFENWPGIANTITMRPDGIKQIYLTDPDGFWIEINDDKY